MNTYFEHSVRDKADAVYVDNRLAIIENFHDLSKIPSEIRMNSYSVAVLKSGKASFCVDGEQYEMGSNDMFFFRPYITLERTMVSADADIRMIVLSPQYTQALITMGGKCGWDVKFFLTQNPIIHLTPDLTALFTQYHNLIRTKLVGPQNPHHRELIDALFTALLYEAYDLLEHSFNLKGAHFTSGENIFRAFYENLNSAIPKYRKVEYYATQLCITPKYLSAICKRLTGKTALQIITDAVIKDITRLLNNRSLTIKEIALQAGFPNQSFLGSYVRKHLGCSPQKYREQLSRN